METKVSGLLIITDVENSNGRIYPKEVFEKAIAEYQKKIDAGTSYGTLGYNKSYMTDLTMVSHIVNKIEVSGSFVNCDITILDTPCGSTVKSLFESGEAIIRPCGTGTINSNHVVEDYVLVSTAVILKNEDAFAEVLEKSN